MESESQKKIFVFAKKNFFVLIFAIIVGLISVAPHLLAVSKIGNDYKGIPFIYTNNEDYYLSRIHEISDGYPTIASPYFFEYKNLSPLVPPIGEYFYFALSFFSFFDLTKTLVLAKFLFPLILFILVFILIKKLTDHDDLSSKLTALSGGLFVTLGYDLVDYSTLLTRLKGASFEVLSVWTRPVNPITGALILFSLLILISTILKKKDSKQTKYISGILFGASVGYFFTFGVALSILATIVTIMLIIKEHALAKKFLIVIGIGFLLDAIYWFSASKTLSGGGEEIALRNGMLLSHLPILNKVLIVATIIFCLICFYLFRSRKINLKEPWFIISSSGLLGGLISFNQQIITGRTIWPHHFVQYTIPIAMIAVILALYFLFHDKHKKLWNWIMLASTCLVLAFGIWNASTYKHKIPDFIKLQEYQEIFNWINTKAEKDCVIFVKEKKEELTRLIPAFTSCNVYDTTYLSTTMPKERILHNYLMKLKINGVKKTEVEKYILENKGDAREYFYTDWNVLFSKKHDPEFETTLDSVGKAYKKIYDEPITDLLKKFRIDYLITDKSADLEIKNIPLEIKNEFETNSFKIYKI